ncbi:MAG: carboxymuconolactone decarboxylase family protein [Dehalococcoidia bacterium]
MTTATEVLAPRLKIWREAPDVYQAMEALSVAAGGADQALHDLLTIRVSQMNGCAYCIDMHTKDARVSGETEQRIYALAAWRETPFFTPRERAALALAEAMTNLGDGHVSDEVYAEAATYFDPAELSRVIWWIAIINTWNRIAITTRIVPGTYRSRRQS